MHVQEDVRMAIQIDGTELVKSPSDTWLPAALRDVVLTSEQAEELQSVLDHLPAHAPRLISPVLPGDIAGLLRSDIPAPQE